LRLDLNRWVMTDNEGGARRTEIKTPSIVDRQLILKGGENGKGWTMVIASETGRLGGSVVEDDGLFAVFGSCTLP
jgi:hypothetical protein